MFYYCGLILVVAAAVSGQTTYRPGRAMKDLKPLDIFNILPSSELDLKSDSLASAPALGETRRVVIGHEPIYGYINDTASPEYVAQSDWKFECPRAYGYYKYDDRSCDTYVECRNFAATLKVCPDGTFFKTSPRWAEYPCGHPPEAVCPPGRVAQPPRSTTECPHQYGFFPIPALAIPNAEYEIDRCRKYISCSAGVPYVMNCPSGLVFNRYINQCDWPENVQDCRGVFKFSCPFPRIGEEDQIFNYRDPNDPECRFFYSCLNGNFRLLACDEGLLFDHRIGRCVEYEDYAAQCFKPIGRPWPVGLSEPLEPTIFKPL